MTGTGGYVYEAIRSYFEKIITEFKKAFAIVSPGRARDTVTKKHLNAAEE